MAQTKVTGTVVSQEDGEPVIGASVVVAGASKTGTVTDMEGHFFLEVPAGKKLTVSYIGMQSQTLAPAAKMVIKLKADQTSLGEVVVTGMQKMDKRLFTGATTKITGDKTKLDGVADISRALEGKAAGVSVQNVSGTFGTAPKIRVRGATSIYGSSKPLWVVDGVIMEDVTEVSADDLSSGDAETLISSAIAGLNADDIESFQILKDGSATSIYGARAMAGVIVVTTKKGKAGTNRINYTGEFTMRMKPSYRNFNIMNSQDQMSVYREMYNDGSLSFERSYRASNSGVFGKMYHLMNTYDPKTGSFGLANTQEAMDSYLQKYEYMNTDWFDLLFSNSISQNHSISMTTGTDKAQYYTSFSVMNDPGWSKQSKVQRYTANVNALYNISKKLSFNAIANASYRKQRAPGTTSQSVNAVTGEVSRDFDINPYSYALNTSRTLDPNEYYHANYAAFNIKNELANNYIDLNVVDAKFQMELKYKPIKELELGVLGAMKYSATTQEHKITENSNQANAYRAMATTQIRDNNRYLYTDPDVAYALPISVLPEGGMYQRTDNRMVDYDFRVTAQYNHTFAQKHIVNLFGGMETTDINRTRTWFNGWGMQYSQGEVPFYSYQFFKKSIEENTLYYTLYNTDSRSTAFYGNATYSYNGKYVINGTIRYEGSNQLGKNSSARWMPTWNVSTAWNVHEEKFFEKLKPLSHLTVRLSYSLTGTPPDASYGSSTTILKSATPYRPFASNKETAIGIYTYGNSDLTYEKKNEFNAGVDLGLWNDRLNVTFDVYQRRNFDELVPYITPLKGTVFANVGKMKSWGEELSISSTNIKKKDFSWQTNFVYSHSKTEITNLYNQGTVMQMVSGTGFAMQGYPVRALFSIPFMGLDKNGHPQILNEKGQVTTYDINFQERNNTSYLKYEGPTDPTYTGSLGNMFNYKGFHLNIFMTYAFGNVVRLNPVFSGQYNDLSSMTKVYKNRWMQAGDENKTNVPGILSAREYKENSQLRYGYNAYNYTTERIAKGDFIRMKEISLAYDFPAKWFHGTAVNNISVKLQATNLFLIYADKKLNGQDPEFINAGGVASPMPRQFTLTLKAGF